MAELESLIAPTVVRLRTVIGALLAGVLVFWAVAIFLMQSGSAGGSSLGLFRLALPLLAVGCLAGFAVFRGSHQSHLERSAPLMSDRQLVGHHFSRTVVGAALAESVGLFSGVGYLLTGDLLMLPGLLVAVLAMAVLFPNDDRLRDSLRELGKRL